MADVENPSARPDQLNPRPAQQRRLGWGLAGIWLFYLWQPAVRAWHLPHVPYRALALATITIFAYSFVSSFARARSLRRIGEEMPAPAAALVVAGALGLSAVVTALIGPEGLALLVYVAVMAVFLLPERWGLVAVVGLVVGSYITEHLLPGASSDFTLQFSILLGALAIWGVTQLVRRNTELAAARSEITRLAVAQERSRFARDLHDILGHSLTVVAVKAELAGRLVRIDPGKAEQEIADVERLSREALHDVRTALSGYREVTLMGEIANARSALAAADIKAELPTALDHVPADRRELFGWVLREGVTNVVRHSGATACRVAVTDSEIRITDDGRGPVNGEPVSHPGVGLVGLRERVEARGGSLIVGRGVDGGFELRVVA